MSRAQRLAGVLQARGMRLPVDLVAALLAEGIDPSIYD